MSTEDERVRRRLRIDGGVRTYAQQRQVRLAHERRLKWGPKLRSLGMVYPYLTSGHEAQLGIDRTQVYERRRHVRVVAVGRARLYFGRRL